MFNGRILLPLFPGEPAYIRERVESGIWFVQEIELGKSDPASYHRTRPLHARGKGENYATAFFVDRVWSAFLDQEDPNALGRLTTADLLAWLDQIERDWTTYITLEEVPDATTNL